MLEPGRDRAGARGHPRPPEGWAAPGGHAGGASAADLRGGPSREGTAPRSYASAGSGTTAQVPAG
ncbi:hypothetical protein GCM10027261_21990 [Geodermatophilus arenarius]